MGGGPCVVGLEELHFQDKWGTWGADQETAGLGSPGGRS